MYPWEGGSRGVGEFEVALSGGDGGVGRGEFVVVGEDRGEVWEGVGLGEEGWGATVGWGGGWEGGDGEGKGVIG